MRPEWDVRTPEGLRLSVEWMRGFVLQFRDQGRWVIPRSGSVIVIDRKNRQAIRVFGLMPETSTKVVFEAMGWKWIDKTQETDDGDESTDQGEGPGKPDAT